MLLQQQRARESCYGIVVYLINKRNGHFKTDHPWHGWVTQVKE